MVETTQNDELDGQHHKYENPRKIIVYRALIL